METIILEMRPEVNQKRYITLRRSKMQTHIKFRIPTRYAPDTMRILEKEIRGQGQSDRKIVCDTRPFQDASTHQNCDSNLNNI